MRAVITVIGKDTVGILAKVSTICADHSANVIDVTQTVMQDLFAMIMLVEMDKKATNFHNLSSVLNEFSENSKLSVHIMHEDIFNSMHNI